MYVLELFSGTGSFGKVAHKAGFEVISVDNHPRFNPTICTDILKWDYKRDLADLGTPAIIWASPPCTEWSFAKTIGKRNLPLARRLVRKTLEIIDHFQPFAFVIENPSGLLKNEPVMKRIPRVDVTYCMYGFPYKKPTNLWSNVLSSPHFEAKHCGKDGKKCRFLKPSRATGNPIHQEALSSNGYAKSGQKKARSGIHAYPLPPKLCSDVLDAILRSARR